MNRKLPTKCSEILDAVWRNDQEILPERECGKDVHLIQFLGYSEEGPTGCCTRRHIDKEFPVYRLDCVRFNKHENIWEVFYRGSWRPEYMACTKKEWADILNEINHKVPA